MTKLEEIARAAYEQMVVRSNVALGIAPHPDPFLNGDWDAQLQILRDDWIESIRAAVEALKPPTDAMLEAGAECIPGEEAAPSRYKQDAEEVFRAMIDAILNETEQST